MTKLMALAAVSGVFLAGVAAGVLGVHAYQRHHPAGHHGGHGEHVTEPDGIAPAIERAFASGKPALVNVEIRQDVGAMKGSTYV